MAAGKTHSYTIRVRWTGNRGEGTSTYRAYSRDHEIEADGKPSIPGSSDPAFRGDAARWNPEEALVSAVSSCHMLWYLHLASREKIVVTDYRDEASGVLVEDADGGGRFEEVVLRPHVTLDSGDPAAAERLHEEAHRLCFISSSLRCEVRVAPVVEVR